MSTVIVIALIVLFLFLILITKGKIILDIIDAIFD